jgi:hypothetical protein
MKTITTLAIAAVAALGAASLSAPASAKGFGGGFKGGGFHGGFKHHGHHGHWGHRRHYGWGYGVYGIPVAAYAAECYYVRRYGGLIKICE